MEFILYRLIQLTKRELDIFDEIQAIFETSEESINRKQIFGAVNSKEQKLTHEIYEIERDKQDECGALVKKMNISWFDQNIRSLIQRFRESFASDQILTLLSENLLQLLSEVESRGQMIQILMEDESLLHSGISIIDRIDESTLIPNPHIQIQAEYAKLFYLDRPNQN